MAKVEKTQIISDSVLDNQSLEMKAVLEQLPKEKVRIMKSSNPNDTFVPVSINGYVYQIKRGEDVEVPNEVRNILIEAGYI
jgi:cytochrome b involved in lipid metabolism